MAIQLPPRMAENELMSRSVMDEPRGGFQQLADLLWGRTLGEQATSAFTGGLGSIPIAKTTALPYTGRSIETLFPKKTVSKAVRSMGREPMQWLRSVQRGTGPVKVRGPEDIFELFVDYPAWTDLTPGPKFRDTVFNPSSVRQFPGKPTGLLSHELAGHALPPTVPYKQLRPVLKEAQKVMDRTVPSEAEGATVLQRLLSGASPEHMDYILDELVAISREAPSQLRAPMAALNPTDQQAMNRAWRTMRGLLRSYMRREP